jgi:hypothetical protein
MLVPVSSYILRICSTGWQLDLHQGSWRCRLAVICRSALPSTNLTIHREDGGYTDNKKSHGQEPIPAIEEVFARA